MINLQRVLKRSLTTAALTVSALAVLSACSDSATSSQLSAYYVLASVDGGSCSLLDQSGTTLAGPVTTRSGVALLDLPASSGMAQLSCQGGTYQDEATGA